MGLSKLSVLLPPVNASNFNAQTISYSPMNAEFLGFMANLVYQKDEASIKKVLADDNRLKNFDYKHLQFIDHKPSDTQALVVADDEKVVVSFRGTSQSRDWLTNLDYKLVQPDDLFGKVHSGFHEAFHYVWQTVKETLKSYKGKGGTYKSIWITGHSLGGALACLATSHLVQEDYPVYGLYTFGQPRVGDRAFARILNSEFKDRYFIFVNHQDIVTRIPTREMGYSHAGNILYFDAEGNLSKDLHSWFKFQDELNGKFEVLKSWITGNLFGDHSMENSYLPLLQKHNNHNPFLRF